MPSITYKEKQEAGVILSEVMHPVAEADHTLSEPVTGRIRSFRYDIREAQALLKFEAMKDDPDECPYTAPVYWAGFQVHGW